MTDPRPRFRRSADKVVAGVAGGIAEHLRVPVVVVRLAFLGLALYRGMGVALYLAYWAFVPQSDRPARGATERQRVGALVLAFVGLVGVLAVVRSADLLPGRLVWPAVVALAGLALVWRQADETQRAASAGRRGARLVGSLVVGTGAVLLLVGFASFIVVNVGRARGGGSFVLTAAVLLAAAAVGWPWWWRLGTELGRERRARIRSQERAEVSAHLHDSVLQTLTLIQRQATSARDVQRLARRQERELRAWLGGRTLDPAATLGGAVRAVADEVEDAYGVLVEVVVVGDVAMDDRVAALLQAAREALVNAAKHSGAETVSVYVEVERQRAAVFVRDRGRGFDPAAGAPGRYGLAESVLGRMERFGGRATVQSAPGEGTEVELELPW